MADAKAIGKGAHMVGSYEIQISQPDRWLVLAFEDVSGFIDPDVQDGRPAYKNGNQLDWDLLGAAAAQVANQISDGTIHHDGDEPYVKALLPECESREHIILLKWFSGHHGYSPSFDFPSRSLMDGRHRFWNSWAANPGILLPALNNGEAPEDHELQLATWARALSTPAARRNRRHIASLIWNSATA